MKHENQLVDVNRFLKKTYLFLFLFLSCAGYGQLPGFTFSATATPQTCLGNGELHFSVTGTQPDASVVFTIYLLPNVTTPITAATATNVGGLTAGSYLVVATQSLNNITSTESVTIAIPDNVQDLQYIITAQNVHCNNDGIIIVNVTSGNAAFYEIVSGPVIAAQQESNIFDNLPVGLYVIKVTDMCGEAVVVSYQLIEETTSVIINPVLFPDVILQSCDSIKVRHPLVASGLSFPVTLTYTVYSPGGGEPIILTEIVDEINDYIETFVPFFPGQEYTYIISISDSCGNTFSRTNNIVQKEMTAVVDIGAVDCNSLNFMVRAETLLPPFTVNFLSAPSGFIPSDYNIQHPVFSGFSALYGGSGNSVPVGSYSIQVTDSCGQTAVVNFDLYPVLAEIETFVGTLDCDPYIALNIPGRFITSVVILSAPAAYQETLPDDVSGSISSGTFSITDIPYGTYTFEITDSCGFTYFKIIPYYELDAPVLMINQLPGCGEGDGSLVVYENYMGNLTTALITSAPEGFSEELPFNVSENIVGGMLYLDELPQGAYSLQIINECDLEHNLNVTVLGYHTVQNDMQIVPHCGSFDMMLSNVSNANNNNIPAGFWLQKYFPESDNWGHPLTAQPYTEGTIPSNFDSYMLVNGNNINLAFTGQFRVIKVFKVYSSITPYESFCNEVIQDFSFEGGPVITAAYAFPCADGTSDVVIDATGVPPLHYSITSKNGEVFTVDNGNNSFFLGLDPATYNFRLTDDCGNIRNIQFDIHALAPMEIEGKGFCEGEESILSVPYFSFFNYQWYNSNNPSVILSTTNTLVFPSFNPDLDVSNYTVTITTEIPGSCIELTLNYEAVPNPLPNAGEDAEALICNSGLAVNLTDYLITPFDAGGTWEDIDSAGALVGNNLNLQYIAEGVYHYRYTVANSCGETDSALLTIEVKMTPPAPVVGDNISVCDGDTVSLTASDVIGGEFVWTGPGTFVSNDQNPVLYNISANQVGTYSVAVIVDGCTSLLASTEVMIDDTDCMVPKGISPNNDGLNDSFDLSNLNVTEIKIYNRFGMQVYGAGNYKDEWYGQSNKGDLPTGAYFYIITRSNNRTVTGWVYLQREIR